MNLFDFNFWQNLLSNALATFFGILIGIPIALGIDRALSARRNREEVQRSLEIARQRELQLLRLLSTALRKNLELLTEMGPYYEQGAVVFFNVDVELLEA